VRSVIFVSGAGNSGTTFLGIMLGNHENGFYTGNIINLFRPTLEYHKTANCNCGNPDCSIWEELKSNGEESLYPSIFKRFSNKNYIVDSSHPDWCFDQIQYNPSLPKKSAVIYKYPDSWLNSRRTQFRRLCILLSKVIEIKFLL
ncbi:MAG: hypothetical protein ABEH43_08085, partial [Flavobacteriales bacterium]